MTTKIIAAGAVFLLATQALAHTRTRCRTRRDSYGNRVETCRTVSHRHHHHDDYGDGFFDGMLASSLILLSTSDIFDDDHSRDFIESEITFALATADEGLELNSELQKLVDETRQANDGKELSDEAILEAYLLEFSK
jgi:hypothetical protein